MLQIQSKFVVLFIIKTQLNLITNGQNITTNETLFDYELQDESRVKYDYYSSNIDVFAAGDICGHHSGCKTTAKILSRHVTKNSLVLAMGDLAYNDGTYADFRNKYLPHWGKFASATFPVVGNHEANDDFRGYFDTFGWSGNRDSPPGRWDEGFYSFDVGLSWHIVALNTEQFDARQSAWLRQDLKKQRSRQGRCILVFGHNPRYTPGRYGPFGDRGPEPGMHRMFKILVDFNVDLYLSGHDHIYARFKKQDEKGNYYKSGTVQFVVGTGGYNLGPVYNKKMRNMEAVLGNKVARGYTTNGPFGVLRLVLKNRRYDFSYLVTKGDFKDQGKNIPCNY